MDLKKKLEQVCRTFCLEGTMVSYEVIQVGNVNKTYRVDLCTEGKTKSFLLQNVNTYVFKDPVKVMENIDIVTEHIRRKLSGEQVLHFHHTADRKTYLIDGDNFWRVTNYIPSSTYGAAGDLEIVRSAGTAFGSFQNLLSDVDIHQLHVTIPDFHNTRSRYEKLRAAVAADPLCLAGSVQDALDYLWAVEDLACTLTDLCTQGDLPLRVTHNDTKINNVLFEKDGSKALVVVDLDTVMPGLVGHDFGDAIRFAANYVEEDSKDAHLAGVNLDVFRAFTEGFLEKTAGTLTQKEIDTLALSCFVLTVELAVRFLADYIMGSPYFKTLYPEHNLVRCRTQFRLAAEMEASFDEMLKIVREACK